MGLTTRIILAAGRGSRMLGQTKALLDFDGSTALALLASLELPSPSKTLVVTGHDSDSVAAEAKRLGLNSVCNPEWEQGQTNSLQRGLRAADEETEVFVLHPVDLPLVRQEDYDAVQRAYEENCNPGRHGDSGICIAASSIGMRRGHPIFFSAPLAREILKLKSEDSVRPIFAKHQAHIEHAVVENSWVRRDLDYPEDYEAALVALAARSN